MVPKVVHRTLGPWWVGGRGWVYEEALTLEDGRVVTRREYERNLIRLEARAQVERTNSLSS